MAVSDAILKRLLSLHPKIIDLKLDRMWRILARLGNPQGDLPPVLHVAGTNGKGSTIAYLRSAMEAAGRNKFDLLISDIALPDGSGMDLMRQLRAISTIPGIAISGFGNNGDIERSLQAGFSGHLIKPIKLDDLEAAIERATSPTRVATSY